MPRSERWHSRSFEKRSYLCASFIFNNCRFATPCRFLLIILHNLSICRHRMSFVINRFDSTYFLNITKVVNTRCRLFVNKRLIIIQLVKSLWSWNILYSRHSHVLGALSSHTLTNWWRSRPFKVSLLSPVLVLRLSKL
jgi:hypothetical protein